MRAQNCEKFLWESGCNRLKRKLLVTRVIAGKTSSCSLAPWQPEVGDFLIKNITPEPRLASPRSILRRTRRRHSLYACKPEALRRSRLGNSDSATALIQPEGVCRRAVRSVGGQPTITRKISRTNSAIAMSLKSVAWGRFRPKLIGGPKKKRGGQHERPSTIPMAPAGAQAGSRDRQAQSWPAKMRREHRGFVAGKRLRKGIPGATTTTPASVMAPRMTGAIVVLAVERDLA